MISNFRSLSSSVRLTFTRTRIIPSGSSAGSFASKTRLPLFASLKAASSSWPSLLLRETRNSGDWNPVEHHADGFRAAAFLGQPLANQQAEFPLRIAAAREEERPRVSAESREVGPIQPPLAIFLTEHGVEIAVFSGDQIKSATDNSGAFDPKNPDIRFMPEDQSKTSRGTSQNQIAATFTKNLLKPGTRNADIGGGKYDKGTNFLARKGVTNILVDRFNRSDEWNRTRQQEIDQNPTETATVNNVLNVIEESNARDEVIRQAAKAIKKDGTAYFLIHEGSTKKDAKAGDGFGRETRRDSWQNYRKTATYVPEIQKHFGNVTVKGKIITATAPRNAPNAREAARRRMAARTQQERPERELAEAR